MKAFYFCFLSLFTGILYAQTPGTLDKTFGKKGRQWDTVGRYADVRAMVIQKDGRIVIGGPGPYKGNTTYKVNRLLANGKPDMSFGTAGSVIIPLPFSDSKSKAYVTYLALLPDGKILAGGNSTYIVKLTANGNVDSSFGTNGIAGLYSNHYGNNMLVQNDGKIVVAGYKFVNFVPQQVMLQRLLPDGKPDKTFGKGGDIVERTGQFAALALLPGGKIVAAGYSGDASSARGLQFLIERFNSNGAADSTFSKDGVLDTSVNDKSVVENNCYITDLALQPDGKMVVSAGVYVDPGYPQFTVCRYNTNGSLDNTFANDGIATTLFPDRFGGDHLAEADKVMISNNKIIAAGYSNRGDFYNESDLVLVSYNSNGTPDSSFAYNGIQRANYEYREYLGSAGLQPDGKIILLGLGRDANQTYELRNILRYYGYPSQTLTASTGQSKATAHAIMNSLHVYPNPAAAFIVISGLSASLNTTIGISDGLGKQIVVYKPSASSQFRCDVSKLTAGIYYIQVTTGEKTETLQFVKE